MHESVYVTVPVPTGATVADPLGDWLPLNAPPISLEADAEQEVALLDVHASITACPKRIVEACAGELNMTVGCGVPP
jgi:hypothetical protein